MIVDFETKCWEGDWEFLLKTTRLEKMIYNNDYKFSKKRLIINNIKEKTEIEKYARKKISKNIIDEYVYVEDYEDDVLNFFEIPKSFKLDDGYKYSISELTGIYLSDADFLVHFSSDSILIKNSNWIEKSIQIIKENDKIKSTSPVEERSRQKSLKKSDETAKLTQIFSDQCYLIPINFFKNKIYNESNKNTKIYPDYGGELFEKRICAYYYNYQYYRIVLTDSLYYSMNYKNLKFIKPIILCLNLDCPLLFSYIADLRRFFNNEL